MKTREELEVSIEFLRKENSLLQKRIKRERLITHMSYLVLIAVMLLLFKCCSDDSQKKENNLNKQIEQKNDSIKGLKNNIVELLSRKAILSIGKINISGTSGKYILAVIAPASDNRPSYIFLPDAKIRKVKVSIPCPEVSVPVSQKSSELKDSLNVKLLSEKKDTINNNLNDSIVVSLSKQSKQDSAKIIFQKKIQLKSFLTNSPPMIDFKHQYKEDQYNPYHLKAKNALWWGVGLEAIAVGLYGASEAAGHPIFIDGRDNSSAQKKQELISGLRIGTGIFGAAGIIKLAQTIHFLNMEAKFSGGLTGINLSLRLDEKPKLKPKPNLSPNLNLSPNK